MGSSVLRIFSLVLALTLCAITGVEAVDEVGGLRFDTSDTAAWNAVAGSDHYNLYRGALELLTAENPAQCHAYAIPGVSFGTPAEPTANEGFFYLVTAESLLDGEGPAGVESVGAAAIAVSPLTMPK